MSRSWYPFLFRCPCCGVWCWTWDHYWRNRGKEIFYCEGCDVERSGRGRGQCEYCQLYPENQEHWKDPRPQPSWHVTVRYCQDT
jgi:hypothetical protein